MAFLTDLLYFIFFVAASPYFIYKMFQTGKYRAGLAERLGAVKPRDSEKPCVWIHGVSVGEVQAARPFIEEFKKRHPDWEIVISSTTKTGIEIARNSFREEKVIYFPLDFSFVTSSVIKKINPRAILLMELEVWPNFLRSAEKSGAKTLIINGRISEKAFILQKRFWKLIEPSYRRIAHICVQTHLYANRLKQLGVEPGKIDITGTMKYDSVQTDIDEDTVSGLRKKLAISQGEKVLVGASTHRSEEEVLLEAFAALRKEFSALRLIIVPRHPERFNEVGNLLESKDIRFVRKSKINHGEAPQGDEVILCDTMGELASINMVADIVFVGGSLIRHGGQNMVEPAGFGKAVLFGPHVFNFQETVDLLLAEDAAVMVKSRQELECEIRRLLLDEEAAKLMGGRARRVIHSQKGATLRNVRAVEKILAIGDSS